MYKIDWQKVGRRLIEFREALNIKNSRQFALSLSIKDKPGDPSYIAKAEKGGKLSDTYISAIEDAFNINKKWLLEGQGEKFGKVPKKVPHGTTVTGDNSDNKYIASLEERIEDLKNDKDFFQKLVKSNLMKLADNQEIIKAHLKTSLQQDAKRDAGGDQKKAAAEMEKTNTRIAKILGGEQTDIFDSTPSNWKIHGSSPYPDELDDDEQN